MLCKVGGLYFVDLGDSNITLNHPTVTSGSITAIGTVEDIPSDNIYKYNFNFDFSSSSTGFRNCVVQYREYSRTSGAYGSYNNAFTFGASSGTANFSITASSTDVEKINLAIYNSASAGYTWSISNQNNTYAFGLSQTVNVKGKPRELKEIGNKATTTLFGVHIDGSRVTQDAE